MTLVFQNSWNFCAFVGGGNNHQICFLVSSQFKTNLNKIENCCYHFVFMSVYIFLIEQYIIEMEFKKYRYISYTTILKFYLMCNVEKCWVFQCLKIFISKHSNGYQSKVSIYYRLKYLAPKINRLWENGKLH